MAFPGDRLPVTVEIAPGADLTDASAGWVYTDITSSARLRDRIRITQGRDDWSGRVAPSVCRLRLDNRSGDFTPRNPLGAYYGSLGRNTPLRVSLRMAEDDFDRTASSGWGTEPTWGGAWTVSGGAASDYSVSGGTGRQSLGTVGILRHSLLDIGQTDARLLVEFTNPVVPTGAAISHWVLGRVTDTNNYYAAQVSVATTGAVTLFLFKRAAGALTLLASGVSVGTHSAGNTWRVLFDYVGSTLRAKAWKITDSEPTAWQVEATDTALTTGTQIGLAARTESGNTNGTVVIQWDNLTTAADRFSGFVSSWPPRWDKSGNDATVPIEANGVLRRLGQGAALRSPLYRSITSDATQPIAWWPLEDGVDSTQAASGLLGGQPMTVQTGLIDFVDDGPPGSAGGVNPSLTVQDVMTGRVSGSGTAWQVGIWAQGTITDPTTPATSDALAYVAPIEIRTSSANLGVWIIWIESPRDDVSGPTIEVGLYPELGSAALITTLRDTFTTNVPGLLDGDWHLIQVTAEQAGGDVTAKVYVDGVLVDTETVVGRTAGFPTSIHSIGTHLSLAEQAGNVSEAGVAHITVYDTTTVADQYEAGIGHAGEEAHERISRLCSEEGIQYTSSATSSEAMGAQPTDTLLSPLQECADADMGVLFEAGFGLGYISRAERYNRDVALTLDFESGQIAEPPEPTDDDQTLRNRWTVRRRDGSWATDEDDDSIASVGLYDDETTVNVETDTVLADHASWRVTLGTVDEMRWPRIGLNLAAAPELIDGWLACGVQSRVTAVNPPDEVAGDDIDVVVEGYSETLGYKDWLVELNCSPARPWDVATADGEPRVAADGSTLATGNTQASARGNAPDRVILNSGDAALFGVGNQVVLHDNTGARKEPTVFTVTSITPPAFGFQDLILSPLPRDQVEGDFVGGFDTVHRVGETSLSIASPSAGSLWTTDPADFPLDVNVGGERMTLSGISGTTSPQTATVSARAVNGIAKAHDAGTEVQVWQPAVVAL